MSAPAGSRPPAAAAPQAAANPHRALRVVKAVVNSGVGESGEPLTKAQKVLQMVTGQKPIATRSHSTNRDFGIRAGQAIGAKVTLRGPAAVDFLGRAFDARDRQLDGESIDRNGNFSFGIADYTDFAGMKYDPAIGIHGMDVAVEIGRAGYRVRDRRTRPRPLPRRLRSTAAETREFLRQKFGVTIVE
ncbi:MAG TPA: 50S ribosomal protein L5 [Thermoplasmata archaeon]|nr:50S ribosomal protein L5 [Thermoplasmata archaeon]